MAALAPQVDHVYVYDNASGNVAEVRKVLDNVPASSFLPSRSNGGMAIALNALARNAYLAGYDAMLLLDQDSIPCDDLVFHERELLSGDVAMVGPERMDRGDLDPDWVRRGPVEVLSMITSGALLSLDAWAHSAGYDERLFVDLVDYEFCLHLRSKGYRLLQCRSAYILHQLGEGRLLFYYPHYGKKTGLTLRPFYSSTYSDTRRRDFSKSLALIVSQYHGDRATEQERRTKVDYYPFQFALYIAIKLAIGPRRISFIAKTVEGWRLGKRQGAASGRNETLMMNSLKSEQSSLQGE